MPELINIRLTKDSPEVAAMDAQAKALGMSRNEMILKAITMFLDFDPTFYKKLEAYSSGANVPIGTALQNMAIKRWAQDNAKKSVWGADTDILLEFSQSNEGVIQPKELYEMVYQMAFDKEAKERFNQLQEEVNQGLELRGEDKDFYKEFRPKFGYKPRLERESLQEGLTFWESDGDENR